MCALPPPLAAPKRKQATEGRETEKEPEEGERGAKPAEEGIKLSPKTAQEDQGERRAEPRRRKLGAGKRELRSEDDEGNSKA